MNLNPKVKVSLRMLKIQHPGLVIRIPEILIRISIPKSVSRGEEVKFGLVIRIPISKSIFGGEEMKFGLMIRIPEIVIRISIPESIFGDKEMKFDIVIRIPSYKAADKS